MHICIGHKQHMFFTYLLGINIRSLFLTKFLKTMDSFRQSHLSIPPYIHFHEFECLKIHPKFLTYKIHKSPSYLVRLSVLTSISTHHNPSRDSRNSLDARNTSVDLDSTSKQLRQSSSLTSLSWTVTRSTVPRTEPSWTIVSGGHRRTECEEVPRTTLRSLRQPATANSSHRRIFLGRR